jgi:hypothetical protein
MQKEVKEQIEMCQLGLDLFCKKNSLESHTFTQPDYSKIKKAYVPGLGLISAEKS